MNKILYIYKISMDICQSLIRDMLHFSPETTAISVRVSMYSGQSSGSLLVFN
ncbi:Uncharacterized protein dnm_081470 [Desulfonema magnum]|uniref:Uncharacterized protein n=1 Tax=Desulfonema magnum TaxID=45655 RepID=A0A975BVI9_9BACT|nr:Uncharacterized protein dnm_081470 [Desulfonema magnum]